MSNYKPSQIYFEKSHMHLNGCQITNSNILDEKFSDVVDIKSAFNIRQFHNKTGYDCFIECEMNYYKIMNECSCERGIKSRLIPSNDYTSKGTNSNHILKSDFHNNDRLVYDNKSFVDKSLLTKNNTAFKYTDNDLKALYNNSNSANHYMDFD